ncbi:FAD-binding protein [Kaistia dalseonensis]|uniref:FAD-binding protein n=1 Tax=Kaistia dalseonensis TaxID=410840 RepID=UPI00352305D2
MPSILGSISGSGRAKTDARHTFGPPVPKPVQRDIRGYNTGPPICRNGDVTFEPRRRSLVWQAMKPDRHPHVIWTAQSDSDIVEALYYARSEGRLVSIVAGGHSHIGHAVQDDRVLLDLSRLISADVDPVGLSGSVQPGVRVAAFDAELECAVPAKPHRHSGASETTAHR